LKIRCSNDWTLKSPQVWWSNTRWWIPSTGILNFPTNPFITSVLFQILPNNQMIRYSKSWNCEIPIKIRWFIIYNYIYILNVCAQLSKLSMSIRYKIISINIQSTSVSPKIWWWNNSRLPLSEASQLCLDLWRRLAGRSSLLQGVALAPLLTSMTYNARCFSDIRAGLNVFFWGVNGDFFSGLAGIKHDV
jgi:hypothetical protein